MGAADGPWRRALLTGLGVFAATEPGAKHRPRRRAQPTAGRVRTPGADATPGADGRPWRRVLLTGLGVFTATEPGAKHRPRRRAEPSALRALTDGGPDADGRPWRRALLTGLGVFAASKGGLAAVSAFAWIGDPAPRRSLWQVAKLWATQYDSPWFTAIADHGYQPTPDASPAAFFPLYPWLIRLATPLCAGRSWLAALVVANAALLAALIVLFRLAEHELGRAAAGRTVFYLVAFPTGFFLSAAYNEGLFIALMAATVYCLRRCRWWLAGALGGLAALSRSAGILLLGAFVFEFARAQGWLAHLKGVGRFMRIYREVPSPIAAAQEPVVERSPDLVAVRSGAAGGGEGGLPLRNGQPPPETPPGGEPDRPRTTWVAVLAGLLIPAGLGVVMVADRVAYGDALAFSHTQAAHWGRHLAWPWAAPIAAMGNPGPAFTEIWAHNLLELATVAFAAVMLVLGMVGPWRLRRDQAVFVLLGWALLLFMISFPSRYTEDIPYPLYSASRIGMEIFPAFMVLSRMGRIERGVLAAFLMVQGLLAAHFLHSGWVA